MPQKICLPAAAPSGAGSGPLSVRSCAVAGRPGKSAFETAVENGFTGTEAEWLASLVGPQGPAGAQGPQGETGAAGAAGAQGPKGDAGPGVPSGGTAGQFLKKAGATDYDTAWTDAPGEVFLVTVTSSGGSFSADRTFAECRQALEDGKLLRFSLEYSSMQYYTAVVTAVTNSYIEAEAAAILSSVPVLMSVKYTKYNEITLVSYPLARKPAKTASASATPTIAAEDCRMYECGICSSLTITSFPAEGSFLVTFTSGSTATVLTVPETLVMPDGFTVEANTRYEISVRNGYALCAGWAVTPDE